MCVHLKLMRHRVMIPHRRHMQEQGRVKLQYSNVSCVNNGEVAEDLEPYMRLCNRLSLDKIMCKHVVLLSSHETGVFASLLSRIAESSVQLPTDLCTENPSLYDVLGKSWRTVTAR